MDMTAFATKQDLIDLRHDLKHEIVDELCNVIAEVIGDLANPKGARIEQKLGHTTEGPTNYRCK